MKNGARCYALMGIYFALNCITNSFSLFFLKQNGMESNQIGILMAVSCLLGGVLQYVAGRLSDSKKSFSWKKQLIIYSGIITALMFIILFSSNMIVTAVFFGIIVIFSIGMMPLVFSACFDCNYHGYKVNFAFARGLGSLTFALTSFAVYGLTRNFGDDVVPVVGIIAGALVLTGSLLMPYESSGVVQTEDKAVSQKNNLAGLVKTYPFFLVMAIGIGLILVLQNMFFMFMVDFVEAMGGTRQSIGFAYGIAAISEIPVMFLYNKLEKIKGMTIERIILISGLLYILRGVLYLFVFGVPAIFFLQLMQGATFGILGPAKSNYAYRKLDKKYLGTGQSIMTVTEVFGQVLSGLACGAIIVNAGETAAELCGIGFAVAGTAIILFLNMRMRNKKKADKQQE